MSQLSMNEIKFRCENTNSSRNFHSIQIGAVRLYFSYETLVAFSTPTTGLCVSENIWGTTTGKHLNYISEKKDRIPRQQFLEMLDTVTLDLKVLA